MLFFWTGRFLFFSKKIIIPEASVKAVPKQNYLILTVERPEAPLLEKKSDNICSLELRRLQIK